MKFQKHFGPVLVLGFIFAATAARAATPQELMQEAATAGKASGELSGPMATRLQVMAGAAKPPMATVERIEKKGYCYKYRMTTTLAGVNDMQGKVVGDLVMVSEQRLCENATSAPPPDVISCTIAGTSCLPPKPSPAAASKVGKK